ncbi:MAG TPA: sugar kinase [Roseiarcus sp.]|nr:sugar kinase [Roseiarcus sp.]
MSLDIVGMGEPMLELNQVKGGDGYRPGFGGDTANTIVAAARSGAKTGYFTGLGEDTFGRAFLDLWQSEGVDASQVKIDADAHTGVYFVTHGPQGHEFSYLRAGSAASRLTEADIPSDYVASARILHVSGISQAISSSAADAVFAAIDLAKSSKALVSYDTNLRLKLWPLTRARAVIHAAMRLADIALPGLDDARLLTGLEAPDAIADFYLRLGAKIVALTLGPEGALVATEKRRETLASLKVEAVDATGAGDTFDGAFLAEYLRTGDPFAAGRFAVVAAALSTRGYGAIAPMPRREETLAAMAKM